MKWYVIKVVTGKEKKMKETIEKELKYNGLDTKFTYRFLIPTQKTVQIRNGKKFNIDKNFFPGYILIECESISDLESNITHISGVSSVLKHPLSDAEVNRILGREEQKEHDSLYYSGQQVKIIEGPFSSFLGSIKENDENKQKVKVVVLIFGREVELDLSYQQISKEEV